MKNIILIVAVALSNIVFAQVKVTELPKKEVVGQSKQMGVLFAELTRMQDQYIFLYRDQKFVDITTYKTFVFKEGDLQTIFNILTDVGDAKVGDEKRVDLDGGEYLFIEYKKAAGKVYPEVMHVDKAGVFGQLPWMTKKQWNKLFGKTEK